VDLYVCDTCKSKFEKPIKTNLDYYYGVSDMFESRSSQEIEMCPFCESVHIEVQTDIYDYIEEEDEDES
jgi:hypothetical protein